MFKKHMPTRFKDLEKAHEMLSPPGPDQNDQNDVQKTYAYKG